MERRVGDDVWDVVVRSGVKDWDSWKRRRSDSICFMLFLMFVYR